MMSPLRHKRILTYFARGGKAFGTSRSGIEVEGKEHLPAAAKKVEIGDCVCAEHDVPLAGNRTQPGAFGFIELWGFDGMERAAYADFLDEAAAILDRPALGDVGATLRRSHAQWRELATMLLPDEVPALAETRQLLQRRYALLDERGMDALPEMRRCHERQSELFDQLGADFPMTEAELTSFREGLAAQVLAIHATESEAMAQLAEVLGS